MIATVAQCRQGMARRSDEYSQSEEGRSKLPLPSAPPGLGAAVEVAKRLTLWEGRRFEDLLRRAEEQTGKRKQRGSLDSAPRLGRPGPPDGRSCRPTQGYHRACPIHTLF